MSPRGGGGHPSPTRCVPGGDVPPAAGIPKKRYTLSSRHLVRLPADEADPALAEYPPGPRAGRDPGHPTGMGGGGRPPPPTSTRPSLPGHAGGAGPCGVPLHDDVLPGSREEQLSQAEEPGVPLLSPSASHPRQAFQDWGGADF